MNILVFAEISDGNYKKSTFEAVSYAKALADKTSGKVTAVSIGNSSNSSELGNYGADKVIEIKGSAFENFNPLNYSLALSEIAKSEGAQTIIISNTYSGKAIAPRVAIKLDASIASGVIDHADLSNGFQVKRNVFSGKGIAYVNLTKEIKVVALTPNSIEIQTYGTTASVSSVEVNTGGVESKIESKSINKITGKIPLTEAEIVVSGGRGMKGPENWGLIEDFANSIGAATACSKPVSDMGWRPHSEHVGQTGITIKPNLYVAVGISGAIQHLAGVSSSKVIVVINKDPEAPFFKAADYGIVGDAFEILPRLTNAARALNA